MAGKLDEAKRELGFISRTLEGGYLDFDTIDELQQSVASVKCLICEHERGEQQPLPLDSAAYRVTIYEPAASDHVGSSARGRASTV
jgi:hypothetical protein